MRYLAPIVEGDGEVEALPALLHRVAQAAGYADVLRVNRPIRVKSSPFLNDPEYFRKHVALAGAKAAQEAGSVLILLDCEDHCPATLGPELLRKARGVRGGIEVLVALAYREYETWFITAARSLRGLQGPPNDLEPPLHPESIRDVKGWLGARMPGGYDPITHQLEFTRAFRLENGRSNPSFDRLCRHVLQFLKV